jgi:hypothetical protein
MEKYALWTDPFKVIIDLIRTQSYILKKKDQWNPCHWNSASATSLENVTFDVLIIKVTLNPNIKMKMKNIYIFIWKNTF